MAAEDSREAAGQQVDENSLFADSFNRLSVNEDGNRLGPDGEPAPRTDEEYAQAQLTLRAIVSSKEAGIIIGKAGKNVADLRDETGVKAGVSKVVLGVHDRVLTVTGGLDGIAKAYAIVSKGLLEGAPQMGMGGVTANGTHRKSSPVQNLLPSNLQHHSFVSGLQIRGMPLISLLSFEICISLTTAASLRHPAELIIFCSASSTQLSTIAPCRILH